MLDTISGVINLKEFLSTYLIIYLDIDYIYQT